mmetsp:Transcript_6492/g.16558  ORF Transcript_6492/g.16558 Transcript_6492/m.16558 type:complete len:258 (+) Transcript_6492:737-1510(+)
MAARQPAPAAGRAGGARVRRRPRQHARLPVVPVAARRHVRRRLRGGRGRQPQSQRLGGLVRLVLLRPRPRRRPRLGRGVALLRERQSWRLDAAVAVPVRADRLLHAGLRLPGRQVLPQVRRRLADRHRRTAGRHQQRPAAEHRLRLQPRRPLRLRRGGLRELPSWLPEHRGRERGARGLGVVPAGARRRLCAAPARPAEGHVPVGQLVALRLVLQPDHGLGAEPQGISRLQAPAGRQHQRADGQRLLHRLHAAAGRG